MFNLQKCIIIDWKFIIRVLFLVGINRKKYLGSFCEIYFDQRFRGLGGEKSEVFCGNCVSVNV